VTSSTARSSSAPDCSGTTAAEPSTFWPTAPPAATTPTACRSARRSLAEDRDGKAIRLPVRRSAEAASFAAFRELKSAVSCS